MNRKYLTLVGVLGLSLLCLNLSAATSYRITEAESGSDSCKIFSKNLTRFWGDNRPGVMLHVNSPSLSQWLSFGGLSETNDLISAGVTFQKGDTVSFTRGTIADWFVRSYTIDTMTENSRGFNTDYGVDTYFRLSGVSSGNTLDFQFAKSSDGKTGGSSGQPLPGILATLLLGGGSAWALRRRRKTANVK